MIYRSMIVNRLAGLGSMLALIGNMAVPQASTEMPTHSQTSALLKGSMNRNEVSSTQHLFHTQNQQRPNVR